VYLPPQPKNLEELKNWIHTALTSVTDDILTRGWQEFEYRCDIVRVAGERQIEYLESQLERFINICPKFHSSMSNSLLINLRA
ncbi:hypothetical protein C0J52_22461, partial [Blattella germanica]